MATEENYCYWANTLIGGGKGALDSFNGTPLGDGDSSMTIDIGAKRVFFHRVNATSGAAESYPKIIKPDTDAGDKRWLLVGSIIISTPNPEGFWITDLRLDADKKIVVKYDETPEA